MKEPRRLIQSGGISQRLLDSASLDRPGPAARRHAAALAATANAFARTSSAGSGTYRAGSAPRSGRPAKTVAAWVAVGIAASVALGFVGSRLLAPGGTTHAAAPLEALPTLTASPDIAAEPAAPRILPRPSTPDSAPTQIEPWVPSPVAAAANGAPSPGTSRPSVAPPEEIRDIEAARAALSRGDSNAALAQLDTYDSSHPNGQLKPESMALRIQVLSITGKTTDAHTLANAFQQQYPQHPLVERVNRKLPR
jgi:TolA-binding protein